MKGPRELKRYIGLLRSLSAKRGKKNGVIPGSWFDDLLIFKLESRCKKNKRPRKPIATPSQP